MIQLGKQNECAIREVLTAGNANDVLGSPHPGVELTEPAPGDEIYMRLDVAVAIAANKARRPRTGHLHSNSIFDNEEKE